MNDLAPSPRRISRRAKLIIGILIFFGVLYFFRIVMLPAELIFYALTGWIHFLIRNLSEIRADKESILVGSMSLVLLFGLIYLFGRRWISTTWSIGRSIAIVGLTIALFVSGFAVVGATTFCLSYPNDDAWTENGFNRFVQRRRVLRDLAVATQNYAAIQKAFPVYADTGSRAKTDHNWQTHLLPHMNQSTLYEKIDLGLPWNHPDNRVAFSTPIPQYSMDYRNDPYIDPKSGYALSRYSANAGLFATSKRLTPDEITDGLSNTLLIGEINQNLPPWGKPGGWRDPGLGINKSPHGFGGHVAGGAFFVLADGSVQYFNEDTDPALLQKLSTPNGGESFELGETVR
ncbi:MAG: hypothetical protein CMJ46_09420 [Planctomyces sp.]|nr:hypothetical protein [Planctomyces sp.]